MSKASQFAASHPYVFQDTQRVSDSYKSEWLTLDEVNKYAVRAQDAGLITTIAGRRWEDDKYQILIYDNGGKSFIYGEKFTGPIMAKVADTYLATTEEPPEFPWRIALPAHGKVQWKLEHGHEVYKWRGAPPVPVSANWQERIARLDAYCNGFNKAYRETTEQLAKLTGDVTGINGTITWSEIDPDEEDGDES